jgi:prevent-host-death family protein
MISNLTIGATMTYWMNAQDAKTNLLKLVNAASAGEEVIIESEGVPAVRIVPYVASERQAQSTLETAGGLTYSLQAS